MFWCYNAYNALDYIKIQDRRKTHLYNFLRKDTEPFFTETERDSITQIFVAYDIPFTAIGFDGKYDIIFGKELKQHTDYDEIMCALTLSVGELLVDIE